MNKEKINWCLQQKKGIELIEPKQHLSEAYMNEADETLENVFTTTGKWKVITAYYACYNAVYALLMKAGIKSEIHDCTIALMGLFGFESSEIEFIQKLKKDRIDTQYYLKEKVLENEDLIKEFVQKSKLLLNNLNTQKTEEIREEIMKISQKKGGSTANE